MRARQDAPRDAKRTERALPAQPPQPAQPAQPAQPPQPPAEHAEHDGSSVYESAQDMLPSYRSLASLQARAAPLRSEIEDMARVDAPYGKAASGRPSVDVLALMDASYADADDDVAGVELLDLERQDRAHRRVLTGWLRDCRRQEALHDRAARCYEVVNQLTQLPVILLTIVSGALGFVNGFSQGVGGACGGWLPVAIGVMCLLSGALSTTSSALRAPEAEQDHEVASSDFEVLAMDIQVELLPDAANAGGRRSVFCTLGHFSSWARERMNHLTQTAPQIPCWVSRFCGGDAAAAHVDCWVDDPSLAREQIAARRRAHRRRALWCGLGAPSARRVGLRPAQPR
jgi:hypothetical protein